MKPYIPRSFKIVLGCSLALLAFSPNVRAAGAKKPAPATNSLPAWASVKIPESVFEIPANPRQGRDPFFPQSAVDVPVVKARQPNLDNHAFVLNGITSPPMRTAMINGSTFEIGEEHELRLADGSRVMVKCEDIGSDSAIILAGGVRRELHLRFGL